MSTAKVIVVAPPAVACENPAEMRYGGVERVAWRLVRMLTALGCDVVPIASADSDFGSSVTTRGLSPVPSWCRPDRTPQVYAEDTTALLDHFGHHVRQVVEAERADAVLMLGPSLPVLRETLTAARAADSRAAAVLHNGPADNVDTMPLLAAADVTLFCLCEAQRSSFGALAQRMEVVTDGIPVAAVPFSADPALTRKRLSSDPAYAGLQLRAERPLVGQIDYFHANKAMLTTLQIFLDSGLWRTHDLVLAGGPGWQLPSRSDSAEEPYLNQMRAFVARNNLAGCVRIHGELTGAQATELYGAMDVCVSPVRLENQLESRDAESYGQGRAIANSAGTPVLMSTAYDSSFSALPEFRFDSAEQGAELLGDLTVSAEMRQEMRAFAERRDAMAPALARYAQFVGLHRTQDDVAQAVAQVVASEVNRGRH